MSRSMLAHLLVGGAILLPASGLCAQEAATLTFQGVVHINRPDVQGMNPVCKGLGVAWICRVGQVVDKGDPVIIFDNRYLVHQLQQRRYDLKIAQARLLGDKLRQESQLAQLHEEQASLEAELAVTGASLVKARRIDRDQVALLGAQYEGAQRKLQEQRRTEATTQALYKLGEVSADELLNVKMQTGKSQSDVELSRLTWQRQDRLIDTLEIARLELVRRELLMKLGLDDANKTPAPASPAHLPHQCASDIGRWAGNTATSPAFESVFPG